MHLMADLSEYLHESAHLAHRVAVGHVRRIERALRGISCHVTLTETGAFVATSETVAVVTALARAGLSHSVTAGGVFVFRNGL